MESGEYPPHPILSGSIACLWTAEHVFQPPREILELMPDRYIELVFSFGAPAELEWERSVRPLPGCYLVGLLDKPCRVRARGVLKSVAARFYAWGFYSLLGRDVQGSPNTVQALSSEWQELARRLEPAVQAEDAEAATAMLHEYLIQRAVHTQFDPAAIHTATQQLFREKGRITIRDLAAYSRRSRRQLERQFRASMGKSPKFMARLVRFEEARERLWRDPHADLASVAQECGYTDQSHFNREFKRFSNRTPREFADEMRATHGLVRSLGVAFVQDS